MKNFKSTVSSVNLPLTIGLTSLSLLLITNHMVIKDLQTGHEYCFLIRNNSRLVYVTRTRDSRTVCVIL